jgi:hypothetical protein
MISVTRFGCSSETLALLFAALLTLDLGIGANVAMFAVVDAVLLRSYPYVQANRLVVIHHRDMRSGISKQFIAIGDYVDLSQRQSVFDKFAGYSDTQATIPAWFFRLRSPFFRGSKTPVQKRLAPLQLLALV